MISKFTKVFIAAAFIVSISACERKSCNNVVCPTGQACNNGQCYCADGYEGSDCQTLSYIKYINLGTYVNEQCNIPSPTTNVLITQGNYYNELRINGLLGGSCYDIKAYIYTDTNNEGNIVEIPQQNCGGSSVSGQGNYDKVNNRLTLNLSYYYSGTPYSCTTILY